MNINYSVVIPFFNEESSIAFLSSQVEKLLRWRSDIEIVLVDNGSLDSTYYELLQMQKLLHDNRIHIVRKKSNTGYGAGIKFGLARIQSENLIWTHGDLQCNLLDIQTAIERYESSLFYPKIFVKGLRSRRPLLDTAVSQSLRILNGFFNKVWEPDMFSQPNLIQVHLLPDVVNLPNDSTFELVVMNRLVTHGIPVDRFHVDFPKRKFGLGYNQGLIRKTRFSLICLRMILKLRRSNVNSPS